MCILTEEASRTTTSWCPPWACSEKISTVPSFSKQSGPWLRKALRGELLGFRREEGKMWTYRDVLPFPAAPNTLGATAVALGVLENVVISHRLEREGGPSCFLLPAFHSSHRPKNKASVPKPSQDAASAQRWVTSQEGSVSWHTGCRKPLLLARSGGTA